MLFSNLLVCRLLEEKKTFFLLKILKVFENMIPIKMHELPGNFLKFFYFFKLFGKVNICFGFSKVFIIYLFI